MTFINDGQRLAGATHAGMPVQTYDDGFGPLWILTNSMGLLGIIRAMSWEDAWSIAEDEFFPEADESLEHIREEYNWTERDVKIIRAADGTVREARRTDYPLEPGQFVRWESERIEPAEWEDVWSGNPLFQDGFGFRPNGPNERDKVGHGIYSKDLNGEALERLTAAQLERCGIALEIKEWEAVS